MCAIYARNMTLFSLFLIIKDELLFLGDGIFWPPRTPDDGKINSFLFELLKIQ